MVAMKKEYAVIRYDEKQSRAKFKERNGKRRNKKKAETWTKLTIYPAEISHSPYDIANGPHWRLSSYLSQASDGYKLKAECLFLICLELLFSL